MSLSFKKRFEKFSKNLKISLAKPADGVEGIYNHKLDLVELYCMVYNIELTDSEIENILDEKVDTAELDSIDTQSERDDVEGDYSVFLSLLTSRHELFGDIYPFIISKNNSIKLKDRLTNKNKIYLILLASSNLNRFREFTTPLTTDFEKITYYSIKNMFKDNLKIVEFGNNADYQGLNSRKKLLKLAKEMKIKPKEERINKIPIHANKDKGIDIVAWIPFQDEIPNMFTIFLQCASGRNWNHKLTESRQINSYLNINQLTTNYAFAVPFEFSNYENEFEYFEHIESGNNILFDRSRLLEYIKGETVTDSFQMVDEILKADFKYN